jgi:hypothetical protein
MAYTVNNTQGAVVATVAENTFDTTTSLTLIGQNKSNFGEKFNENMIFLLENFANSSAPASAITGQLWWDTASKLLKINTSDYLEKCDKLYKIIWLVNKSHVAFGTDTDNILYHIKKFINC